MKLTTLRLLAGGTIALAASYAAGDVNPVIFRTGFEKPTYTTGPLFPQDHWTVRPAGTSKTAAMVQETRATEGSSSVCIIGGYLGGSAEWLHDAIYQTSGNRPIVNVSFDVLITPASSYSAAWQMNIYDVKGQQLVGLRIIDGGTLTFWSVPNMAPVPAWNLIPGTWGHLDMRLDYVAGTVTLKLDGNTIGSPYPAPALQPGGWIGGIGIGVTGPAADMMYIDALEIAPQPRNCRANCDGSTEMPILTVNDFLCFQKEFGAALSLPYKLQVNSYANFDGSTTEPVLTVNDYMAFLSAFASGCP